MAISDLVGKVFSSNFIAGVEEVTPILSLANDRSSEVQRNGDGLEIAVTQDLVSIADYPASADITYSALVPTKQTFVLDKKKYIAFSVEDIDSAQIAFNLFSEGARQAGIEFSRQLSADFRTKLAGATPSQVFAQEITKAGQGDTQAQRMALALQLLDMRQRLITDGYTATPVMLCHPETWKRLMRFVVSDKGVSAPTVATRAFSDALLSGVFGVDVIVDWGATVDSSNPLDNATSYVFARGRTLTYAGQLSKTEQIRSDGRFATNWRALQTYGILVQEPRSLLRFDQTFEA